MAKLSSTRYFLLLLIVNIFYFRILNGEQNNSFSFKNFSKNSNFHSELALYGDARVVNGGESVQISGSMSSSAGRVVYKKPFKFGAGNPRKMVSFSMSFVFSMSKENGGGLVFMMVPVGFPLNVFGGGSFGLLDGGSEKLLGIEFATFLDDKDNRVGVDVGSMISVGLRLKGGEKLESWIDYEASSRRLEVRLGMLGANRPVNPLLSRHIDLSQMWKGGEVFVGLSTSNGNSTRTCNLYSWSFALRTPPYWMHSEPLDPSSHIDREDEKDIHKKSDCVLRVLAALIFGTGCGALVASVVLFMWTIFGYRRPVVPEDYALPTKEVGYETQEIVVGEMIIKDDVME